MTANPPLGPSVPTHTVSMRLVPLPTVWLKVRVSLAVVNEVAASKTIRARASPGQTRITPKAARRRRQGRTRRRRRLVTGGALPAEARLGPLVIGAPALMCTAHPTSAEGPCLSTAYATGGC